MKKIYTCFACGFPIAFEETEVPAHCPGCGAPRSQFLEEPWCGSIEKRRIHVDPPEVDPNRDPYDISFHPGKDFAPLKGHGRNRKLVMSYEPGKVEEIRSFYTDLFGWDIIETEHSDPENPVLFCATGPGTPDWEPRVCSFEYVFLKPKTDDAPDTSIIIEVKDIDETLQKAVEFGGKVLKERFTFEGEQYALIEDSEGNPYYIWEIKDKLPDYVTNPVTRTGAQ
ncbi:MAG: hypothetical protein IKP19_08870 [Oscillospiraceae bacterium]|nr:hypothetical protein [Oscillospiraceae bacterium]